MAPGSEQPVFIGIDFGTTFSTVSFVRGFDSWPKTIDRWPSSGNGTMRRNPKAPTALLRIDASLGPWGFQTPYGTTPFRWFKLGLPHPEQLPKDVTASAEYRQAESMRHSDPPISSKKLAAGYLRKLWDYAMEWISEALDGDDFRMRPMHVVMGIPAIWSADSLIRLREAAHEAGIANHHPSSTLQFIAESEAAALSLLQSPMARQAVKTGETLLICDCGGGTADATTYEVVSLEPPTLKECVTGGTAFCGPILMDGQFMALLKDKIRERTTAMTFSHVPESVFRDIADNLWDNKIKPDFRGLEKTVWSLQLPHQCINPTERRAPLHVKPPTLEDSSEEVSEIFDPTVDKIVSLVGSQCQSLVERTGQGPQHIILCGGFGGNEYVRMRLASRGIKTIVHSDTERLTAVATGACLRARESHCAGGFASSIQIQSRVARESYAFRAGSSVRQFITRGESISINPSYRVVLRYQDLTFRMPGRPSIIIFQYPDQVASLDSGRKVCEISWPGAGLSPGSCVEVGVHCLGIATEFQLYLNDVPQTEGVRIKYV